MNDITRTSKEQVYEVADDPVAKTTVAIPFLESFRDGRLAAAAAARQRVTIFGSPEELETDAAIFQHCIDVLRASLESRTHEPCPVTETDEAAAFHRWWDVENREMFVVAYGHDEPYEKHPNWGRGHMSYAKKGWLARAKLSPTPPPAVGGPGQVSDADAAASELLQSYFWLKTLKPNTRYVRLQDDHDGEFRGHLSVTIGEDGDAWVALDEANARFRMPGFGGGASQYTRTALVILAEAIRRDNAEHPRRSAPTKSGEQA